MSAKYFEEIEQATYKIEEAKAILIVIQDALSNNTLITDYYIIALKSSEAILDSQILALYNIIKNL